MQPKPGCISRQMYMCGGCHYTEGDMPEQLCDEKSQNAKFTK